MLQMLTNFLPQSAGCLTLNLTCKTFPRTNNINNSNITKEDSIRITLTIPTEQRRNEIKDEPPLLANKGTVCSDEYNEHIGITYKVVQQLQVYNQRDNYIIVVVVVKGSQGRRR